MLLVVQNECIVAKLQSVDMYERWTDTASFSRTAFVIYKLLKLAIHILC